MNDRAPLSREAIEAMKARFLKEAEEKFYRDMEEAARLATTYPDLFKIAAEGKRPPEQTATSQTAAESASEPAKIELPALDGTMRSLVARYRADPESGFRKAHFRTRQNYDSLLKRILDDCGDWKLADVKAPDIDDRYKHWKEDGRPGMTHSLVTMLRMVFGFGALLGDAECERLSVIMHKMRFRRDKRRSEQLTSDQVKAIRAMAHHMKRPSIALAQAIQFECGLKQRDVIGEWLPIAEQGSSDVIHDGEKWLRGLRWSDIGENLILRHANRTIDLRQAPMVMEELALLGHRPTTKEPMIVCEFSRRPWTSHEFRRWWRKVADACGIPKHVRNMDSRPRASAGQGLVSETVRATEDGPSVARR